VCREEKGNVKEGDEREREELNSNKGKDLIYRSPKFARELDLGVELLDGPPPPPDDGGPFGGFSGDFELDELSRLLAACWSGDPFRGWLWNEGAGE